MGEKKKSKTMVLAPETPENSRAAEAWALKVAGSDYDAIGESMGVTAWVARELCSAYYVRLATETADELRATSEARLDRMIRDLNRDLNLAANQQARNGIYALILKAEAQRATLLGLNIPADTPDAKVVRNA
ncbi:hypothetical protein ASF83_00125 [Plantibacter sp. Leaf171]|uniref:hypothetical protein n=1 Tax=unclassified Plantibacter TaxID=2624265 RepID=UPI0006F776DD|nr:MULTISPECIES: hypothetical protein [unclassified Plantibacter]KQM17581.1 hypothetical protein ASE44_00125 [Plantibacter sp. Leaf1]KQR60364.1 hypothetical protein ASF83_00125 [Plantibacter sp. Leaf171]